ncbi:MAG: dehydrogenase, partial [Planctomycetes bacterium]|nr:dehydrogenase [Planctomycetota bacterium]
RKLALPLFPQLGLEPNVYYIPPIHVPDAFNRQMFGPGAKAAAAAYRAAAAAGDRTLAGLLALFGSTLFTISRFKVEGDAAVAYNEKREELVRVPIQEPVFVRSGFDEARAVARLNTP